MHLIQSWKLCKSPVLQQNSLNIYLFLKEELQIIMLYFLLLVINSLLPSFFNSFISSTNDSTFKKYLFFYLIDFTKSHTFLTYLRVFYALFSIRLGRFKGCLVGSEIGYCLVRAPPPPPRNIKTHKKNRKRKVDKIYEILKILLIII